LLAREGGRGDEYMKYEEVFLTCYYSSPIAIFNKLIQVNVKLITLSIPINT
jgi:hypothetical protein